MNEFSEKKIEKYPAKTLLFKENDFSKDIFLIKSGQVQLYKKVGNKNMLLSDVGAGSLLGELAIIDNGARSATAVTSTETELIRITPLEFQNGIKDIPDWYMSIARVLAQRLRNTNQKLTLSEPVVLESNVTSILMYLISSVENSDNTLSIKTLEDCAIELLQMSVFDIQKILVSLEKNNLITLKQTSIKIESIALLESHLKNLRKSLSSNNL